MLNQQMPFRIKYIKSYFLFIEILPENEEEIPE